jgi:hypothetical protein
MSDRGGSRLQRRGFLRGLATLAIGCSPVDRLARAAGREGADRSVAAAIPDAAAGCPVAVPTATVWLGYPVRDASGSLEAYRPPHRIGSADRLPSVFWVA